jgi:hypothetical protein
MKELVILLSKSMPIELLLEKLQDAILALKLAENEETKREALFYCQMLLIRLSTEGKETIDVIKDYNGAEKILDHFKESQNVG